MLNSKLTVVFVLIIGIAIGGWVSHEYDKVKFSGEERTLLFYVNEKELLFGISDLHLLLIKHYTALQQGLESQIPDRVKTLRNLYASRNSANTDAASMGSVLRPNWERQKSEMVGSFALLYGLNEKFPIRKWRNDKALMQVLGQAAKSRPKYVKWLRCQDWTMPMWVRKDECGKRKMKRVPVSGNQATEVRGRHEAE